MTKGRRCVAAAALICLGLTAPLGAQRQGRDVGRDVGCSEWRECRDLALAAAANRDFERFHDLAWRAVQLGPPRDPALLTVLARAQALSGRPHDALVMLDRLAGMGVAVDAATSDDFAATRQLQGWPEVAAHIDRVRQPAAAAAPPPASPPSLPRVPPPAPPPPLEGIRFSTARFTPGGLAYDAVSARFLFADRLRRKLFVVSEQSNRVNDYVRADSAGFQDIAAIDIDARRGDLWVASAAPGAPSGTLHKLQLISGRLLHSYPVAVEFEPVSLVDLGVTPGGVVFVLDAAGGQVLALRPGATALERLVRLDVADPASIAGGQEEGVAYVAHRDGVSRVDLRTRTVSPLSAPAAVSLARLERIRVHDRALVAVRRNDDGSRRIVRFDFDGGGRGVAKETILEQAAPIAAATFLTFSGNDLVYLADGAGHGGTGAAPDASPLSEFVTHRVHVR